MTSPRSRSANQHALILLLAHRADGLVARKTVLEEAGHTVLTASSIEQGTKLLNANPVQILMVDYRLKGKMTGMEFIGKLKEENGALLSILLAGSADILEFDRSECCADEILEKNANEVTNMLRLVTQLLKRPARRTPKKIRATSTRKRKQV